MNDNATETHPSKSTSSSAAPTAPTGSSSPLRREGVSHTKTVPMDRRAVEEDEEEDVEIEGEDEEEEEGQEETEEVAYLESNRESNSSNSNNTTDMNGEPETKEKLSDDHRKTLKQPRYEEIDLEDENQVMGGERKATGRGSGHPHIRTTHVAPMEIEHSKGHSSNNNNYAEYYTHGENRESHDGSMRSPRQMRGGVVPESDGETLENGNGSTYHDVDYKASPFSSARPGGSRAANTAHSQETVHQFSLIAYIRSFFVPQRWMYPTEREARDISVFTIFLAFVVFAVGLAYSIIGDSSSTLAFALESLVDVLSSVLVLWRFWGNEKDPHILHARERRASVLIAVIFVISACVSVSSAIRHLMEEQPITSSGMLLSLTIPTFIILFGLGIGKIHISKVLGSVSLKQDGVASLGGSGISFGIVLGIVISRHNNHVWFIDAAFAVVIGAGLGLFGLHGLCQGDKWWTPRFWRDQVTEDMVSNDEIEVV